MRLPDEFHSRKRSSGLTLPWEEGYASLVLSSPSLESLELPLLDLQPDRAGVEPLAVDVEAVPAASLPQVVKRRRIHTLGRVKADPREEIVRKWSLTVDVFRFLPFSSVFFSVFSLFFFPFSSFFPWQLPLSEAKNPRQHFPNKECNPGSFCFLWRLGGCGSQALCNRSNTMIPVQCRKGTSGKKRLLKDNVLGVRTQVGTSTPLSLMFFPFN